MSIMRGSILFCLYIFFF